MKKLFCLLCVLCILIPARGLACDAPAVKIQSTLTFTGSAFLAMEQEQHIIGMISETERAELFTAARVMRPYVRGVVENGVVRAKGALLYREAGGVICGLTSVGCTVVIYPQYAGAMAEIIARLIGEEADLSAETILACTQWRTASTITHIFYTDRTAWAAVGSAYFDGAQCPAILYIGDFNGDGAPEPGFLAGGMPQEPERTKEPDPPQVIVVEKTVHVEKVVEKTVVNNCTRIIQDNRQINIGGIVKNKNTMIVNIGGNGCKPCLPMCLQ